MSESEMTTRWKDDPTAPARIREVLNKAPAPPPMPSDIRAAIVESLPQAPPAHPAPVGLITASAVVVVGALVAMAWIARNSWAPSSVASPRPSTTAAPSTSANAPVNPSASGPPSTSLDPSASATLSTSLNASPSTSSTPWNPRALTTSIIPHVTPARSGRAHSPSISSARDFGPVASPTNNVAADTLAEESALINSARAALAPDPARTLAAVDEHARRFSRGELAPEREYLRISALRRLGRTDDAKAASTRYLAAYPTSPHAPLVRTFLTDASAP